MTIDYLKEITQEALPLEVYEEASVDKLRVLHAAGMVEMEWLPQAPEAVRVLAVTGLGRAQILADRAHRVLQRRKGEPSTAWADLE
jgi:hypothetical protein